MMIKITLNITREKGWFGFSRKYKNAPYTLKYGNWSILLNGIW